MALNWQHIAAYAVHRFGDIDPQEAEDVKQDVVLHLISKRAMIESATNPRAYAQQTACNYVAGYCQGCKRHTVMTASLDATAYPEQLRGAF